MASELDDRQKQEQLRLEKERREGPQRTFGERAADAVNRTMGSWHFIIVQSAIIVAWISLNTWLGFGRHFDPFPFLLLNISLSLQAAYAAPLIQLAQNRANDRDAILREYLRAANEREEEQNARILELLERLADGPGPRQ